MTTDRHSESPSSIVFESAKDVIALGETASSQPRTTTLQFHLTHLTHAEFCDFVAALSQTTGRRVTRIHLQADIYWNTATAQLFVEWISALPNLRSLFWTTGSSSRKAKKIPLPLLTMIFTRCPQLESLSLDGLQFLSIPRGWNTDTSLQKFCQALKKLKRLKLYHAVNCSLDEEMSSDPVAGSRALRQVFVDETLKSLSFVRSIECIDIRETTNPPENRVLLGLIRNGELADAALQRLQQTLRTDQPCQKLRLWIGDQYQGKKNDPLLREIGSAMANNSTVQDFRVRGSAIVADRFLTSKVIGAYEEILQLGQNMTLTSCDLMTKQGGQIDFFCRLNRMSRGDVMQRLQQVTKLENWLEEIILPFVHDLDALFYWIQLHPVFVTPAE